LTIESILQNDASVSGSVNQIWYTKKYSEEDPNKEDLRKWWIAESLKRYLLLCIIMDTAVKMAYVGCSTGWILDADEKRGTPQVLTMIFEPIDVAVKRMSGKSLRFDRERE
jgi:hypothetical protein